MTVKIAVNIAAQVVAAGIYGNRARITLSLVPIFSEAETGYDLVTWPNAVEALLRDSRGFAVIPLKSNESWRTDTIFNGSNLLTKNKLTRIGSDGDARDVTKYWQKVMGEDAGFEALKAALDPNFKPKLREPLDAAFRDPESGSGPFSEEKRVPDIHGTSRDKTVKELAFERAAHIAASLKRVPIDTRPEAKVADALQSKILQWRVRHTGPVPRKAPLTDAFVAAMAEDDDAYGDLKDSRLRADNFSAARRIFLQTTQSSTAAIDALLMQHQRLLEHTPLWRAIHFSDTTNFTDKLKRAALTRAPLKEAAAAYRLASRTPAFNGGNVPKPEEDAPTIEFARRRLFTLQSNPSLGRLFRFVVDFHCAESDLKDLTAGAMEYPEVVLDRDPGGPSELPAAVSQHARFLLLRLVTAGESARLWSAAKFRPRTAGGAMNRAGHFLPCTREEIDARVKDNTSDGRKFAVFEQIDGVIDLGQRWKSEQRYQIVSLDPIVGIGGEDAKVKRRAEEKQTVDEFKATLLPQVREDLQADKKATQRGGGLALTDRWRQLHGIARFLDSAAQRKEFDPKSTDPNINVVLDASDLTAGYKLDVGIRPNDDPSTGRNYWHTLMHRTVQYSPTKNVPAHVADRDFDREITRLYPDADARRDADDAQLQAPAALRDWLGESEKRTHTTVFMEEVIAAWRGDPLGLACGVESHKLDPNDLRIDISYNLPTGPALTPPPLRFGWCYHFGLRAHFAGGVSLPLNRALGHYEKSRDLTLALPPAGDHGESFLRYERIEAPTIAIPDWLFGELTREPTHTKVKLAGKFPAPQASRMIVRSLEDGVNRSIADVPDELDKQSKLPGVGFDRRVIMAPAVPLDFAALHDAFRKKTGSDIERNIKMYDPRVLSDVADDPISETKPIPGEEEEVGEFTPVPEPLNRSSTREGLRQRWQKVRIAWRSYTIASRPRGGLRGVDHRAAWGGFPVYRASASQGAREPVVGQPVAPQPAPLTDEGEILHRVKGAGVEIFSGNASKRRSILWSAVGILPKNSSLMERSGTAVFRPLPNGGEREIERQPYYPDPAAVTLVIQVAVRGEGFEKNDARRFETRSLSLYASDTFGGSAPPDYPDAVPVVLDVVRGRGTENLIKVNTNTEYGRIVNTPPTGRSIKAAHVTVTLAQGEEARISCWCVPTVSFLQNIFALTRGMAAMAVVKGSGATDGSNSLSISNAGAAFRQGVAALTSLSLSEKSAPNPKFPSTFAGLPLPAKEHMLDFAQAIRKRMLEEPLREIAAVTEIEAVHGVDLPLQEPQAIAGQSWQLLRATAQSIVHLLKPVDECKPVLGDVCMSANWSVENQMPDAVDVILDGSLTVHGPSTEAVEIRARGAAAARGRFDDVERGRSRDDRSRGLWPKPDAQEPIKAKRLFGFEPAEDGSVHFENETITLLRVEGFAPGKATDSKLRINLLDFQRRAKAIEPKPGHEIVSQDAPLRVARPTAFPDTRARWIEIFAVAMSRHGPALRTRYDELPEILAKPKLAQAGAMAEEVAKAEQAISSTILDRRWLASTVRPARISPLSPIPSFWWSDNLPSPASAKLPSIFVNRSVRVRVRMKRPWFSSGEGERLGLVIWPPNLFAKDVGNVRYDIVKPPPQDRKEINLRTLPEDGTTIRELQDADLGPGGNWVTRWGADPTRAYGGLQGWLLSKENFPEVIEGADFKKPPEEHPKGAVLVRDVLMPVPADPDAAETRVAQPPGGFMVVSLVTYMPRFDPDQENWYVDLNLDPCGSVYPFVRLGLVRYQPNAARTLQVSEPIIEWTQVMPERRLSASAKYIDVQRKQVAVTAVVAGVASGPGDNNGHPESSPAQAPRMYFRLLQRRLDRSDEIPGSEMVFAGPQVPEPGCSSPCTNWTAVFQISEEEYRRYGWSVFVEEVDRLRPATYADEPRYETLSDTNFVDTGPRFVARLSLDNLQIA